jgi:phosphatidylserine/phosphatidylglycerophosphate/cardiolipin synthase-like enzyme
MEDDELVGGVLIDLPDPRASARVLAELLAAPAENGEAASQAGFDPDLIRVLRRQLGDDAARITSACDLGAAWVMGRRSIAAIEPWDLVASLPAGTPLPPGLRRTTAETLVHLVARSVSTVRLAAPFIDWPGISFLADALAAATRRGVDLQILIPTRSTHAGGAIDELEQAIRRDGDPDNFALGTLRYDAPWAHLKVLSSDSTAAYIGSANVTGAGIAGHNLELGVLVRGPAVAVVEQLLNLFRQS